MQYTEEENKFILDNHDKISVKDISEKLGRSVKSIYKKLSNLKLYKKEIWPIEKIEQLKDLVFKGFTHKEIGYILGKTESSVLHKCLRNKISINKNIKHRLSNKRIYTTYRNMIGRCYNNNRIGYEYYGGRGITVCQEWRDDFMNFYNWSMNNGYSDELTIDRINVNGNYDPNNCRWITQKEQANNRGNSIYITAFGETKTAQLWAEDDRSVVGPRTIINRINNGFTAEQAIMGPHNDLYPAKNKEAREWFNDNRCVCSYGCLIYRLEIGWDPEKAITTPSIRAISKNIGAGND